MKGTFCAALVSSDVAWCRGASTQGSEARPRSRWKDQTTCLQCITPFLGRPYTQWSWKSGALWSERLFWPGVNTRVGINLPHWSSPPVGFQWTKCIHFLKAKISAVNITCIMDSNHHSPLSGLPFSPRLWKPSVISVFRAPGVTPAKQLILNSKAVTSVLVSETVSCSIRLSPSAFFLQLSCLRDIAVVLLFLSLDITETNLRPK